MTPANITLWARDTASDLQDVPSTFSSWDKCMAKEYCKRRNKTPKHFDNYDPSFHQPPPPAPNPVYQAPPAPPSYVSAQQRAPSFRGAQQTARFDAPKSPAVHINEDALPEMPTWAGAVDKHVEDPNHHDDVEMEPLNHPDRRQGAGAPGTAYSDYSPNPTIGAAAAGYRGFGPTDPHARRSPGPGAAFNPVQDPYGRRSPGMPSPGAGIDPHARRSPGPAAALNTAQDPYGRRSPGPAAAFAVTQDPYGRRSPGMSPPAAGYGAAAPDPYRPRSPGLTSPVGAPVHNPYDQQQYHDSYDDQSYGAGDGYHAVTAPSPVAAYKPHTNYSPVPMAFSPSSEMDHSAAAAPTPGFQRQPSFGSSQYPPTYTSQPAYRAFSPGAPPSPPAFSAPSPSEYTTYNPHANATPIPEPDNNRPPSVLQSGKKPTFNASSNF
ncbi:uncharacterized protein N7479_002533 [Penicillium vulpinum]|uniref:uncharacterized protein n=1 Tax=Penicillium vulpinum TaxID=29845 RepID=UPI002548D28F|nr:uncharacterized protein N7479_002533 [Penicillium vulpinum]KAJ5972615.1 hypothetical protein N7479_002533 [Penicillium vulpinum]